jgi:hypothetical protein
VILLDANVILLDVMYTRDVNYPANRTALDYLAANNLARGITTQAALEVVGKQSFNTPAAVTAQLHPVLLSQYGVRLIPDPTAHPAYAGCTIDQIVAQMTHQMALGDAVLAVQIVAFAPAATALLTWNAKHLRGKVCVPVLTPADWLTQQPPAGPTP